MMRTPRAALRDISEVETSDHRARMQIAEIIESVPRVEEQAEIGVAREGWLARCGWADCPGLDFKVPIHEHEWGFAHDLCRMAMDAGLPSHPPAARYAVARVADRNLVLEWSSERLRFEPFATASTEDGADHLVAMLNAVTP